MPARANSICVTSWPGLPPSTGSSAGQAGTRRSPDAPPLSIGFTARAAMRSKPRLAIHSGAHRRQAGFEVDGYRRVGIRAGAIVGAVGFLARGRIQRDLAERHVDVGPACGRGVDLAGARNRAGGDAVRAGSGLRLDGHGRLLHRAPGRAAEGRGRCDCGGSRPYAGMTRFRFKGHRAAALCGPGGISAPVGGAPLGSRAGCRLLGGGVKRGGDGSVVSICYGCESRRDEQPSSSPQDMLGIMSRGEHQRPEQAGNSVRPRSACL